MEHLQRKGVSVVEADVTNMEQCREVFAKIENVCGQIDLLVCNAGAFLKGLCQAMNFH